MLRVLALLIGVIVGLYIFETIDFILVSIRNKRAIRAIRSKRKKMTNEEKIENFKKEIKQKIKK